MRLHWQLITQSCYNGCSIIKESVRVMAFYNSIDDYSNFVISFTSTPQQDFWVFAKGYTRAASCVAEHLLGKQHFSDYEAYPVVFLYRQAFELYLKGLYHKAGFILCFKENQNAFEQLGCSHRLVPFADFFTKICKLLFPSDQSLSRFAVKVRRYAGEFEEIDSGSDSYRYPVDKKGNPIASHHQLVNLNALHTSMNEVLEELEAVVLGFEIEATHTVEVYEIIKEIQAMFACGNGDVDLLGWDG
jgi:hypothetical protein